MAWLTLLVASLPLAGADIEPQPASIAGFVGLASAGPLEWAEPVESWAGFVEIFGDTDSSLGNPYLAPSVEAFFANGGERCFIARVCEDTDDAYLGACGGTAGSSGLEALRAIDEVSILCVPGVTSLVVQRAMIAQCEELGDRLAVLDGVSSTEIEAVESQRRELESAGGFAALYYPWLLPDPGGVELESLPPSGFVAGVYARVDREQGLWRAPEGRALAASGVVRELDSQEIEALSEEGISALRMVPGRGPAVWSARTTSSDPEWKYVNVRRLFIFLEESIDKGTQWAVFEENDETLWSRLRNCIESFLLGQWQAGAFQGTRPEAAFFVKVDETTMTQEDLDQGRTNILVGFAPLQPAEFVVIKIGHQRSPAGIRFDRGDVNADGAFDLSDPVGLLGALFLGEPVPPCLAAADFNGSGELDLSDGVYGLSFLFLGGPPPPPPFGGCGVDPSANPLACAAPPDCR